MKTATIYSRGELIDQIKKADSNTAVIMMHNKQDKGWYKELKSENSIAFYFNDVLPIKKSFISKIFTSLQEKTEVDYMTEEDAKRMFEFIKKNKNKNFYISCEYGKGRSIAVARFLEEFYDFEIFNIPDEFRNNEYVGQGNAWVIYQLLKVSGLKPSKK